MDMNIRTITRKLYEILFASQTSHEIIQRHE